VSAVDPRVPLRTAAQRAGRADRVLQRRQLVRVRVAVASPFGGPISLSTKRKASLHVQRRGVHLLVRGPRHAPGRRQPGPVHQGVGHQGRPGGGPRGLHHADGPRLGRDARLVQSGQRIPVLGVHGVHLQGVGPAPGRVPVDVRRADGGCGTGKKTVLAVRRDALQLAQPGHRMRGQRLQVVHGGRVFQTDGRRPRAVGATRRQVARNARRQDLVQRAVSGVDIHVRRRLVHIRVEHEQRRRDHQMVDGAHRGGVLRGPAGRDHRCQLRPVRRSARHRRGERQRSHVGPQHRCVLEPTADPVRRPDIRSLLAAQ